MKKVRISNQTFSYQNGHPNFVWKKAGLNNYKRGVAKALINMKPRLVISTVLRVLLQKFLPWYEVYVPFKTRLTVFCRFLVVTVLYHVLRGNVHAVLFFEFTFPLLLCKSKVFANRTLTTVVAPAFVKLISTLIWAFETFYKARSASFKRTRVAIFGNHFV